jgi:hypothetical protein
MVREAREMMNPEHHNKQTQHMMQQTLALAQPSLHVLS